MESAAPVTPRTLRVAASWHLAASVRHVETIKVDARKREWQPLSGSDEIPQPPSPPVRRRVFVAEIVCLLCGRQTGTAMCENWPPSGPILFQPTDARTPALVRACL